MYIATNNKVMFSEQSVFEGITGACHPSGGREGKGREVLNRRSALPGGELQPPGAAEWPAPAPSHCPPGRWGRMHLTEA